jgi:hypothetical protein
MKMTREEVAKTIENFVNGTGGKWDWDDFVSIRLQDAEVDEVRKKCVAVRDEFPPSDPHQYCSEAGMKVLADLAASLRTVRA